MTEQNFNPHDDFFKVAFSRKEVAADYITQFLDKNIVKNIDLQSLTLSNTSYVTSSLDDYFSDVVWEGEYGISKNKIKIAFLFEHKSFVPKYPHLQLLRYMLEIWEECEKNKKPLTPIVPIILYHNKDEKRHWKYKPFASYFKEIDDFLLPYIPNFDYQLTDLTTMSDEQLVTLQIGLLYHSLRTLKFGSNQEYVLKNIDSFFVSVKNNEKDAYLETFLVSQLVYILKNNDISPDNTKSIIQKVKKYSDMSAYDYIIKEAVEQGLEQGLEQGRKLEREENRQALSIKDKNFATSLILSTDFDDEKIASLVGVEIEFVSNLRTELDK